MFKIGDKILYGSVGVCEICEVCEKNFANKVGEYYVLVPVYRTFSTVYVPVDSNVLCEKMRRVGTKDEIEAILKSRDNGAVFWDENKYNRRETFTKLLETGTIGDIASLCRVLKTQADRLSEKGKKLNISDERALADAEKLIEEAFALACGIDVRDVKQKIVDTVENSL